MSDDEDYMSDKFLHGTEQYSTPSIARRNADKRELELLKRKAEIEARLKVKNVSVKVMEKETREKGLASAITSDNKGYKLLEKMGYTPGQGIGKKESGISEPIPFDLKTNRLGLGKEPRKKPVAIKNSKKVENINTDDFRGRIAQKRNEQMMETDLRKSQKSCEQLDMQNGIEKPDEIWYWPIVAKKKDSETEAAESTEEKEEEEEEEEEQEAENDAESNVLLTSEKLDILTKYLRDKYFYCIWCGAAYNNEDDLRDNCSGKTRDDH